MRINVYSQELTSEVKLIAKESDGIVVTANRCHPIHGEPLHPRVVVGDAVDAHWRAARQPDRLNSGGSYYVDIREEPVVYHAAQLMLHSSPMLHHPPMDDDRSAVTFWLPKSKDRREAMAKAFEEIARIFREAPSGSGLD